MLASWRAPLALLLLFAALPTTAPAAGEERVEVATTRCENGFGVDDGACRLFARAFLRNEGCDARGCDVAVRSELAARDADAARLRVEARVDEFATGERYGVACAEERADAREVRCVSDATLRVAVAPGACRTLALHASLRADEVERANVGAGFVVCSDA